MATLNNQDIVVIDTVPGKYYDGIEIGGAGGIIFDSAGSLHYLAWIGDGIFLVEETVQ